MKTALRNELRNAIRRGMPRGGVSMLLVVAATASMPLRAQAAGSIYLRDVTAETRALTFDRFWGRTEIYTSLTRDRAAAYDLRESLFAPEIHLGTEGSVYHSRFLAFDLMGGLRFNRIEDTGTAPATQSVTFDDYRVGLRFFKDSRVGARVFASRDNNWTSSPFRQSYRVATDATGASFTNTSEHLPVSISVERRRSEDDYLSDQRITEEDQARAMITHRLGFSRTVAFARWVGFMVNEPAQDYRTVVSWLDNTLDLPHDASLRSRVRYFNQYGTIARRDFALTESADIDITPTLTQRVEYRYRDQTGTRVVGVDAPEERIQAHHGEWDTQHLLWGSLRTVLNGYFDDETFFSGPSSARAQSGTLDRWWIRPELRYQRRTPRGQLSMRFGYHFGREEQSAVEGTRAASNEEHVLADGNEPQLDNPRVDASTIVVTDETGFIVYQDGIDYTITTIGPWTQIFRVATGNIPNGQTILVDYRYVFSPNLTFNSRRTLFAIGIVTSKNLSVNYQFDRIRDAFVSGDPTGILDNQTRHVVGASYRFAGFRISDEYESNDLISSRFRSNRFYTGYGMRAGNRINIDVGTNFTHTRFVETDLRYDTYLLSARASGALQRTLRLETDAWIRFNRRNTIEVGSNNDYTGLRAKLTKTVGMSQIALGGTYRNADETAFEVMRYDVFLRFRRDF